MMCILRVPACALSWESQVPRSRSWILPQHLRGTLALIDCPFWVICTGALHLSSNLEEWKDAGGLGARSGWVMVRAVGR